MMDDSLIINYKLLPATNRNKSLLIKFKLNTIFEYANNLSKKEKR